MPPEPRYADRWQFFRDYPDLCVCDVCGQPVGPISSGWAHEYASAAEFVAARPVTAISTHAPTVRGHER